MSATVALVRRAGESWPSPNPSGFIEEVRILCKPWGITPGPVRASLWTGEFDRMHPPSHARRVAELIGGDPPVTVVPGVEQIGLIVIFEEALRFAAFGDT